MWLKFDHEYASSVRSPPTTADGSDVSASIVAIDGVRSAGHFGANTRTTSAQLARSSTTSIAGGCEARVAAVNKISTASNVSPSTSDGSVVPSAPPAPLVRARRTARRFAAASTSVAPNNATFVARIEPYPVPTSPATEPT